MKVCLTPECGNITEGRTDFCSSCNRRHRKIADERKKEATKREMFYAKSKPVYKKPAKVSAKRLIINEEYFKLVEQFKKDNPLCKAKINEYCTVSTQDVHHSKGRGKNLLVVSTWIPVCRNCHNYLHDHPVDAMKRGLSQSRLSNESAE